jgi:heme A synthase
MKEESERGRLRISEGGRLSELVLTNFRVYHHRGSRSLGDYQMAIPLQALTAVRVGWQRHVSLLVLGIGFLGLWTFFFLQKPDIFLQYLCLSVAFLTLLIFLFYRTTTIEIVAQTATIKGTVNDYEKARSFYELIFAILKERMGTGTALEGEEIPPHN